MHRIIFHIDVNSAFVSWLGAKLYYAGKDSDFLDEVIKAKDLCYEYNQIRPTDFKAQHEILTKLLGKIGEAD